MSPSVGHSLTRSLGASPLSQADAMLQEQKRNGGVQTVQAGGYPEQKHASSDTPVHAPSQREPSGWGNKQEEGALAANDLLEQKVDEEHREHARAQRKRKAQSNMLVRSLCLHRPPSTPCSRRGVPAIPPGVVIPQPHPCDSPRSFSAGDGFRR